jgi:hypothetical protein
MTMPKIAQQEADVVLARLDRLASTIQTNHASWGMPVEIAKTLVNDLDKTADEIELASFGPESFEARRTELVTANVKRAQVIESDKGEGYMSAFANPMAPVQVEGDEPYMSAYKDDQSSAVRNGKATNGRPLT